MNLHHGYFVPIAVTILQIAFAGGIVYFMYSISKSLRRIAEHINNGKQDS